MELLAIVWDIDPVIYKLGPITLKYYGILFALGFFVGYPLMQSFYRYEGKDPMQVDTLAMYMIISTILGARLGHVFFYQPEIIQDNPLRLFATWEGGLSSHGAAIGIFSALWLYSRTYKDQPYLWLTDKLVITVALAGVFIRIGNVFNSEIYGHVTDKPWGFIFVRAGEVLPRHPTGIYEALCYLVSFGILLGLYRRMRQNTPEGLLLGLFFILIFTARFFIEFLKEVQVDFEKGMALNMGQLLSIPLILIGIWLVARVWKPFQLAMQQPTPAPIAVPVSKAGSKSAVVRTGASKR